MNEKLDKAVDFFLTHPMVKERLDFIIKESENSISSITLIKEFKDHITEQIDAGFKVRVEEIPNQFNVFLLFSGYPIKVSNGTIRMN